MKKGCAFYTPAPGGGKDRYFAAGRRPNCPWHCDSSRQTSDPQPVFLMPDLLTAQDIKSWLKKLPEWEHEKKQIERTFEFDEFSEAIDFVNSVAEIAEEEEHHPDIDVRFNKVRLVLTTHDKGGITDRDFEVAEKIDNLFE
jgi:4a-hydroxytetrahydrobiopterin dehydratase